MNRGLFLLFILGTILLLPLFKMYHTTIVIDKSTDTITNDYEESSTGQRYKVNKIIITNKSKSPIYFEGTPSISSCGTYSNEKIYYVTMTIDFLEENNGFRIFDIYANDIETKVDSNETRVFREWGEGPNNKYIFDERNNEKGKIESQTHKFVTDVYFLFLFTKNPYKIQNYTEYVEVMKKNGYAVLGYHDGDGFYFTITDIEMRISDEMKLSDNPKNDLLLFVHTIRDNTQVTKRLYKWILNGLLKWRLATWKRDITVSYIS